MPKVTNLTDQTVDFIVGPAGKDGVPKTDSVAPGETKNLDITMDTPRVRSRLRMGVIEMDGAAAKKAMDASVELPGPESQVSVPTVKRRGGRPRKKA
jgi:hypothetical protein